MAIDESNYERIHEQAGAIALQVDSFTPAHSPFGMPIDVASLPAGSIQRVCRDAQAWLVLFPLVMWSALVARSRRGK